MTSQSRIADLERQLAEVNLATGCRRSHPHEDMNATCERFTEYERQLASERARREKAEAELRSVAQHSDRDYAKITKLQRDLNRATSIGMAMIYSRFGPRAIRSAYLNKIYDELKALHTSVPDAALAQTGGDK